MKLHSHLLITIAIFVILLLTGAYTYHQVEGWNNLDSMYFTVVTVTTIGYGDLTPQTPTGKIFTMIYSFIGIAFALYFISTISSGIFKKHLSRKVSEIKYHLKKEQENEKNTNKRSKRK